MFQVFKGVSGEVATLSGNTVAAVDWSPKVGHRNRSLGDGGCLVAISLEPLGGAPAGSGPTGPVLLKGSLIETAQ